MNYNEIEDGHKPVKPNDISLVAVLPLALIAVGGMAVLSFCLPAQKDDSEWTVVPQIHLSTPIPIGELPDFSDEEDPQDTPGYIRPTPLAGVYSLVGVSKDRSPEWSRVRDEYYAEHPNCAFKGCTCVDCPKQIHHIKDFGRHPELELDKNNLVTVCFQHHLDVCHQGSFREINEYAREDLASGSYPAKGIERMNKRAAKQPSKTTQAP